MNGIIVLCHFCELHGPSVLFCTQAFHSNHDPLEAFTTTSGAGGAAVSQSHAGGANGTGLNNGKDLDTASYYDSEFGGRGGYLPPLSESSRDMSRTASHSTTTTTSNASSLDVPSSISSSSSSAVAAAATAAAGGMHTPSPNRRRIGHLAAASPGSPAASNSTCSSCRSLPDDMPGFITNDHTTRISYISSQYPDHPSLYSHVRQACVRSLSCEVCPGREGAVIFGDDKSGYVFSYTFFVRDAQARGFQRWYSIISLMTDRIYLVNSWHFLVSSSRELISDLQKRANHRFEADQAKKTAEARFASPGVGSGFGMTPDQFRRRRGGHQALRSLQDLSGDERLFSTVHTAFAWTLKACGERMFERQIEGPPLIASGHPADLTNQYEMIDRAGTLRFATLSELIQVIGIEVFTLLLFNVVIGNQLVVRGPDPTMVASCLRLVQDLIPIGCCNVDYRSTVYKDSWQCNLLGLTATAEVPPHVDTHSYVLLDMTCEERPPVTTEVADGHQHANGATRPVTASFSDQSNGSHSVDMATAEFQLLSHGRSSPPNFLSDSQASMRGMHSVADSLATSQMHEPNGANPPGSTEETLLRAARAKISSVPSVHVSDMSSNSTHPTSQGSAYLPPPPAIPSSASAETAEHARRLSTDSFSILRFAAYAFSVTASNQSEAETGNSFTKKVLAILLGTMYTDAVKHEFVVTLKEEWMQ
ncbi:hypothetical protein, variant [Capsaspora owczarzaki ATCC 30864]|uniref:Folliculin n=1 Tax=Capsaspora owczarzaki (strain ATCC 30864) TaxID=595528 RepID=A0A0D2VG44_CAPO3|nr:hypothetical protein, variant [Capsaspora owczarzaki ATCC 30864]KJE88797.1 hypothetical protein, variant [Capsaspora owczarzaki ATCC 30864]|eukprot:XP_011269942.1 hypothetical protein, variant [Capsaspora owczarzaki ATCC 30864]